MHLCYGQSILEGDALSKTFQEHLEKLEVLLEPTRCQCHHSLLQLLLTGLVGSSAGGGLPWIAKIVCVSSVIFLHNARKQFQKQ